MLMATIIPMVAIGTEPKILHIVDKQAFTVLETIEVVAAIGEEVDGEHLIGLVRLDFLAIEFCRYNLLLGIISHLQFLAHGITVTISHHLKGFEQVLASNIQYHKTVVDDVKYGSRVLDYVKELTKQGKMIDSTDEARMYLKK